MNTTITPLRFSVLSGEALHAHINELARLRISVFRDFLYLYDGDMDYEARYLKTYIDTPHSVVVLALDGDTIVGASTGISLISETDEVKEPFLQAGYDVNSIFYCGESVLDKHYRGRGAGVAFFEHREAHARSLPGITTSCFCAVQRPENHPARPADYVPLDGFWRNWGYEKKPELETTFSWQEVNEQKSSPKPMMFWMKSL